MVKNKNINKLKREIIDRWQLYLMLLIPVIYIFVFAYYPMMGIQIAFKKFTPSLGIWGSEWIGLENFKRFFSSYYFERTVMNTVRLAAYTLIAGFPIPIILALTLNSMRSVKYKKVIQMAAYIPHFISTVVLVGMLVQIINPRVGILGIAYEALTGSTAPNLMGQPEAFPHLYVWSGIWQSVGWNSIIYMAALSGVDMELHEAAKIDGASRFKRILYVDFPSIIPTMVTLLILNAGSIMSIGFEKVYLMQNDLNLTASEVISTYAYKVAFSGATSDFSFSTAINLFNSIINFVLIIIVNQISKKIMKQSLW